MLRIRHSAFSLLLISLLALACNKNGPKEVATNWLNAVYHADYDAALPYSTETTKAELEQLTQLASYVTDSNKKELKKLVITVKNVQEKGDTALATYQVSDNDRDQTLLLVRQKGKWLVAFTKDDTFNNPDINANAQPAPTDSLSTSPTDTSAADTAKNRD